ncbi:zinc ribbon domain-containing protein [Methylomonas sp. MED-D]|uniref:zinc ribbon domain-containing protein n=1 Tax=Methylomonas sp. MED-D TaxID=3418768 RepID=UPI003CFEE9D8
MLIKCKECGKEISSKAEKCPHCGVKRNTGCLGTLLLILAALVAFTAYLSSGSSKPSKSATSSVTHQQNPLSQAQKENLKNLINEYIKAGIFTKIDASSDTPHAFIGRSFQVITIDDKRTALNLVKVLYASELVTIYDGFSGKRLGYFDGYNLNMD